MSEPVSTTPDRLEAAYRNLDRSIGWVQNADNKALIVLAFQGAVVAGLAAAGDPLRTTIEHQRASWQPPTIIVLLIVFTIAFAFSAWKSLRTLLPDATARGVSPFFFGSIAGMNEADFRATMRQLDGTHIEEELNRQTFIVSGIADRKFARLRFSIIALAVELGSLLISTALAEIGKAG